MGRRRRDLLADLALTAALFVLAVVAVYGASYNADEGLIVRTPLGVLVVLIGLAPVAVRRLWPIGALTMTCIVYTITAFTDRFDRLPLLVGVLVCLFTYVAATPRSERTPGLAIAGVTAAVSVTIGLRWHGSDWLEWIRDGGLELAGFIAAGVLGDAVRSRDEMKRRLSMRAEMAEDHAVDASRMERARIARELHDIVGHAISVISVQATVGEHLAETNPAQAKAALGTIHEMSQQAMTEMRMLVDVLRDDDEATDGALVPQPGLTDLQALLDEARSGGADIDLEMNGTEHDLSAGVGLAVYRVVQESLTNARKHSPGAKVRVALRFDDDRLVVEIVSDPRQRSTTRAPETATIEMLGSSGYGLLAMRERVAVFHGSLDVGEQPDGSFAVRAELPYSVAGMEQDR